MVNVEPSGWTSRVGYFLQYVVLLTFVTTARLAVKLRSWSKNRAAQLELPLSCKEADFDMLEQIVNYWYVFYSIMTRKCIEILAYLQILDIFQCSTCHFLSKLISPCSNNNKSYYKITKLFYILERYWIDLWKGRNLLYSLFLR